MSSWVKADWQFEHRTTLFFVTVKMMLAERIVLSVAKDEPELLEAAALELIHRYRPELAGCTVYCMCYSADKNWWEFGVCHASLPKVLPFNRPPSKPLDPAYEAAYAEEVKNEP